METSAHFDNLLGMGRAAELAGNNEEAIQYYNRVLEADSKIQEAWLGKGRAAGWLSTLQNIRINETLVAFQHAIGCAGDTNASAVATRAVSGLTTIAVTLFGMAKRHRQEFATVISAQHSYISAGFVISDALNTAKDWQLHYRPLLNATVDTSRDMLNVGVNEQLAAILRKRMADANAAISQVDPDHQAPTLAVQTEAQKAQDKADFDNLGYIVLFVVVIFGIIITAVS